MTIATNHWAWFYAWRKWWLIDEEAGRLKNSTTMDERIKTCFWWWSLIIMVALCPQSGLSSRTLQKHESLMCDKQYPTVTVKTVYSFVHDKDLYSASSVELLRSARAYCRIASHRPTCIACLQVLVTGLICMHTQAYIHIMQTHIIAFGIYKDKDI